MKAKQDQQAAGCVTCDFEPFVRNNYFTGKMMGAAEFIAESYYHQEKLRLHQARLHGWGIVCGLQVLQHPNKDCQKRYVRVEPGSAVDCCGRDILVPEEEMLDLLCFAPVAALAQENPPKLHALGVCVRFAECATEQVPVLYDDCGCDDDGCAPNRVLESYALEVMLDPPLAVRVCQDVASLSGTLFVRSPDPSLAVAMPRFGVAPVVVPAAGNATLYALDAGQPNKVLAFELGTLHARTVDMGAAVYALGASGAFAFVATAPLTGTKPLVQILQPGGAALAPVEVADAAAATNTLSLVTSTDPNRTAIAYVRETGAVDAFAADAAAGLKAPPASLGSITANMTSFVAKPDGKVAYAIDSAGMVQVIQLISGGGGSTSAPLGILSATAKPTSLAYLGSATQSWLLVADRTNKLLYIVDVAAAGTLLATVALDHPPEYVTATAQSMVYLVEEEGGAQYLQAIDAAPLLAAKAVVVEGPRLIGGSGLRIVALENDSSAALLASTAAVDGTCDGLVWAQLADCGDCETPNCLTLATIERYQTGAAVLDADPTADLASDIANLRARIDNREGRRILASSATLQAWLECLQTQGAQGGQGPKGDPGPPGPQGPAGIGLYVNLPKILDIGWRFEEARELGQVVGRYYNLLSQPAPADVLRQLVKAGGNLVPPLTIYFNKSMKGVTRRTLSVSIDGPLVMQDAQGALVPAGIYLPIGLKLFGDIIEVPGPIPTLHTGETAAYAVSFLPAKQFFIDPKTGLRPWPLALVMYMTYQNGLTKDDAGLPMDLPRVLVELRGEFVYAPDAGGNYTELGVLDATNVGGRVGEPPPAARLPPIQGQGQNPSGNLTQGGLFSSWFFLSMKEAYLGGFAEAARAAAAFQSFGANALALPAMPPVANFSSAQEIAAGTGVSASLARRIVAERNRQPFAGVDDFRKRLALSEPDWAKLQSKLVIL